MNIQLAVAVAILLPAVAHADEWSHTQEFAGAQSASIRVVEPDGYTVTVGGRTDTVPAVFAVDNANAYVVLAMRSPEGATWSKKIEVREYRQTVLRVRHVKSAPPPNEGPKERPVSYVGTVKNSTDKCRAEYQMTIKLDFVRGPDVVRSTELKAGARASVELATGSYNVRRYQLDGSEWVFDKTETFNVRTDGWEYDWGCVTKRRR